jgi:hypothetical protein
MSKHSISPSLSETSINRRIYVQDLIKCANQVYTPNHEHRGSMTRWSTTPTHPFNDVLDVGYDYHARTLMQSFPFTITLVLYLEIV